MIQVKAHSMPLDTQTIKGNFLSTNITKMCTDTNEKFKLVNIREELIEKVRNLSLRRNFYSNNFPPLIYTRI